MKLCILHLSDSHFRTPEDFAVSRAGAVVKAVFRSLPDADAVAVVFSGDIAFSGRPEQYEIARRFLEQVCAGIRAEKVLDISVVVCPGNHDCDFAADGNARRFVIEAVREKGESGIDDDVVKICTTIQNAFFEFRAAVSPAEPLYADSVLEQRVLRLARAL